jgi:hypothetical protein
MTAAAVTKLLEDGNFRVVTKNSSAASVAANQLVHKGKKR